MLKLIIPYPDFQEKVDDFIAEMLELSKYRANSLEDVAFFEELNKSFNNSVFTFLQTAFNQENNSFYQEYKYLRNKFHFSNTQNKDWNQQLSGLKYDNNQRINILKGYKKTLKICDVIRNDSNIDLEERLNMTIGQVQAFVLEKLYQVFDDSYYPITQILTGNGIPLKRLSYATDISDELKQYGLIDTIGGLGGDVSAKLTGRGAKVVEDQINAKIKLQVEKKHVFQAVGKSLEEKKSYLQKRLSSSDFENAIDEIGTLIDSNRNIYKDYLMLNGRISRLNRKIMKGIISDENASVENMQIMNAFIELIETLENEDLKNP